MSLPALLTEAVIEKSQFSSQEQLATTRRAAEMLNSPSQRVRERQSPHSASEHGRAEFRREAVRVFAIRWANKIIARALQVANIIDLREQKGDSSYCDNYPGTSLLVLLYKSSGESRSTGLLKRLRKKFWDVSASRLC